MVCRTSGEAIAIREGQLLRTRTFPSTCFRTSVINSVTRSACSVSGQLTVTPDSRTRLYAHFPFHFVHTSGWKRIRTRRPKISHVFITARFTARLCSCTSPTSTAIGAVVSSRKSGRLRARTAGMYESCIHRQHTSEFAREQHPSSSTSVYDLSGGGASDNCFVKGGQTHRARSGGSNLVLAI